VRTKGTRAPKTAGAAKSIAQVLRAKEDGQSNIQSNELAISKTLTAIAGTLTPNQLTAAHVMEAVHRIDNPHYANSTRTIRCGTLRRWLLWLWEEHGAPKLDGHVPHKPGLRPRGVTASREQIDALIDAAKPALKLLLLMCSDLAIRSGTAVQLAPENYNPLTGEIRFTSKKGSKLALPVTDNLASILNACDQNNPLPFITQVRIKTNANAARHQKATIVDPITLRRELKALPR
jgi:hypothetical protein